MPGIYTFPDYLYGIQADLIGGTTGNAVPLMIFGGASIVAAVLTLILPETLGQVLPETIEDGKNFAT